MKKNLILIIGFILLGVIFVGSSNFVSAYACANGQGNNCHCDNAGLTQITAFGVSSPCAAGDYVGQCWGGKVVSYCAYGGDYVNGNVNWYDQLCTAGTSCTVVNGSCGTANGVASASTPSANLCSAGSNTTVTSSGNSWTWDCNGSYGTNASCSAPWIRAGACGTAVSIQATTTPTTNLCSVGTPTVVTGTGPWNWSCSGVNGGTTTTCVGPALPCTYDNAVTQWSLCYDTGLGNGTGLSYAEAVTQATTTFGSASCVNVDERRSCALPTISGSTGNGGLSGTSNCGGKTYLNWNAVVGAMKYYIYKDDGQFLSHPIKVLIVAGGGGGAGTGGGGGAGGLIYNSNYTVSPGNQITVTVGNGGAGHIGSGDGANGGNSIFGSLTAIGGGAGGVLGYSNGYTGGSGGGGGGAQSGSLKTGGQGTSGQGSSGGGGGINATLWGGNGGGGGAGGSGGAGNNSSNGGNGGAGLQNAISGTNTYYAGGGGGGEISGSSAGTGGAGGGGAANTNAAGSPGTANTGGGGGGGSYNGNYLNGGNGGTGIIIVRYNTADFGTSTTGTGVKSIIGSETIYTFTSSGSITFAGASTTTLATSTTATSTVLTSATSSLATYSMKAWSLADGYSTSTSNLLSITSSGACENGVCVTNGVYDYVPTDHPKLCLSSGTSTEVSSTTGYTTDPWKWYCLGSEPLYTSTSTLCSAIKTIKPGVCGYANNTGVVYTPTGLNACTSGNIASLTGLDIGPWTWSCLGSDPTITTDDVTNCKASKLDPLDPNLVCTLTKSDPIASSAKVNTETTWKVSSTYSFPKAKWTTYNGGVLNPPVLIQSGSTFSKIFTTVGLKKVTAEIASSTDGVFGPPCPANINITQTGGSAGEQ